MADTDNAMPDNPDPVEVLKQEIIACAERQKGFDIADRLAKAPVGLLKRMVNRELVMMRALLDEFNL